MAPVMVWPLASLSGAVSAEPGARCDHLWRRVAEFGAHEDHEIARLWERVRREETRVEHEARRLWSLLAEFGATEDAEIGRLWRSIVQ